MIVSAFISAILFLFVTCPIEGIFVADSRIQNPNLTPSLGRGYSTSSAEILSTCLTFKERTEPTYNYAYDFMEITHTGETSSSASGSFQASLSWGFISASIQASMSSKESSQSKSNHLVTKMAMERYYSSLDDTTAALTPDAVELLQDKGDVIGFYQSCGSGYIRSIRRVAEVTAIFSFESNSVSSLMQVQADLKVKLFGRSVGGGSLNIDSNSSSSDTKMTISIKAFGLGLNMEGSDTLVARSIDDYQKTLDFAFKSMLNDDVGMIRGIEVVSWTDNLQFQKTLNFRPIEQIDIPSGTEDSSNPPVQTKVAVILHPVELKAITTINAEFITEMYKWYRRQMYLLSVMRNCVGELDLLKRNFKSYYLVDHKTMDFSTKKHIVTVETLSGVVNSANMNTKYLSMRNFVKGFYGPCASAIQQSSNNGRMTKYFWDIDSCFAKASCLAADKDYITENNQFDCKASGAVLVDTVSGSLGLDEVIEKYCMPEIDYSRDQSNNPSPSGPVPVPGS